MKYAIIISILFAYSLLTLRGVMDLKYENDENRPFALTMTKKLHKAKIPAEHIEAVKEQVESRVKAILPPKESNLLKDAIRNVNDADKHEESKEKKLHKILKVDPEFQKEFRFFEKSSKTQIRNPGGQQYSPSLEMYPQPQNSSPLTRDYGLKNISQMSLNAPAEKPNPMQMKFQNQNNLAPDYNNQQKNYQNTQVRGPGQMQTVQGSPNIGTNTYLDQLIGADRGQDVQTNKMTQQNPSCPGCPIIPPKLGPYYDPGVQNQAPPGGAQFINIANKNTPNAAPMVNDAVAFQSEFGKQKAGLSGATGPYIAPLYTATTVRPGERTIMPDEVASVQNVQNIL